MNLTKVQITSFGATPEVIAQTLSIGDATLQVLPSIPYEELIDAIQWSINSIIDDRTYVSEPIYAIIRDIALLKYFTNLDCTDIGQEYFNLKDFYEWYDILKSFDVITKVKAIIATDQVEFFETTLEKTIHSIIAYKNSAAGIIDRLTAQNVKDNVEMQTVLQQLNEPEMAKLLDLMSALGQDAPPMEDLPATE